MQAKNVFAVLSDIVSNINPFNQRSMPYPAELNDKGVFFINNDVHHAFNLNKNLKVCHDLHDFLYQRTQLTSSKSVQYPVKELADILQKSPSSISRRIKKLSEEGWLKITHTQDKKHNNKTGANIYELCIPKDIYDAAMAKENRSTMRPENHIDYSTDITYFSEEGRGESEEISVRGDYSYNHDNNNLIIQNINPADSSLPLSEKASIKECSSSVQENIKEVPQSPETPINTSYVTSDTQYSIYNNITNSADSALPTVPQGTFNYESLMVKVGVNYKNFQEEEKGKEGSEANLEDSSVSDDDSVLTMKSSEIQLQEKLALREQLQKELELLEEEESKISEIFVNAETAQKYSALKKLHEAAEHTRAGQDRLAAVEADIKKFENPTIIPEIPPSSSSTPHPIMAFTRKHYDLLTKKITKSCMNVEYLGTLLHEIVWSIIHGSLKYNSKTKELNTPERAIHIAEWMVRNGKWSTPFGFAKLN